MPRAKDDELGCVTGGMGASAPSLLLSVAGAIAVVAAKAHLRLFQVLLRKLRLYRAHTGFMGALDRFGDHVLIIPRRGSTAA